MLCEIKNKPKKPEFSGHVTLEGSRLNKVKELFVFLTLVRYDWHGVLYEVLFF